MVSSVLCLCQQPWILDKFITEISVFQRVLADGSRLYMLLYVDDILIAGKSRSAS